MSHQSNWPYYRFCRRSAGIFLFSLLVLFSCKNEIDLDIPKVSQQIVVDGWIENGDYPYVILTLSSQYYSVIDSASLRSLVLSRAKVTVNNGKDSEILTLVMNNDYFPPSVYRGTRLTGEAGKTYNLTVEYGGRIVKASTTIPQPAHFDSLWFELNKGSDSLGVFKCRIADNRLEKNYYRTFYKIRNKNKKYIPTLISNFDDKYLSQEMTIPLNKGNETYLDPNPDFYFKLQDTVYLKLSTVDESSHKFWISYDEEIINAPNPFASSHKEVLSNIQGGIGIWCGYGSTQYLVIANKK